MPDDNLLLDIFRKKTTLLLVKETLEGHQKRLMFRLNVNVPPELQEFSGTESGAHVHIVLLPRNRKRNLTSFGKGENFCDLLGKIENSLKQVYS